MVRRLEYSINEKETGITILNYLKSKGYSTTIINNLKKTPVGIRKNGEHVFVNERLSAKDTLQICLEEQAECEVTPFPYNLSVLYEDEDILVVNKPYSMPIHPSINHYGNTLSNAVAYYMKQKGEAYPFRCINRLDRDTSGATIIAKNALSAGILSNMVKERRIKRTYLALVEGVTKEKDVVDLPIGRKEGSIIERQVDKENGKRAVTHYLKRAEARVENQEISLLELKLETGRTHQIRVHMSHIGHPLLGDFLYNEKCTRMNRQALHSARLQFEHPITGALMTIEAPLPEDMEQILI